MLAVSVVIPCYNAAAFAGEAVRSVWAQTRPACEVVCVDDGSTDETAALLHALQSASPIPMTVLTGPNGGASQARNRGTEVARGDLIQYLDADDLLGPDKLRHQAALVEAAPEPPALVAAAYAELDLADGALRRIVDVDPLPWRGLVFGRLGITSANLYRRHAVLEAGAWDPTRKTSEDPELAFRMMKRGGRVLRDPAPLTQRRWRPGSLWHADQEASRSGWWALRREILAHLRTAPPAEGPSYAAVLNELFPHLRALYADAPGLAVEVHREIGPVSPSDAGSGPLYSALYRLLGFGPAERIARVWSRR